MSKDKNILETFLGSKSYKTYKKELEKMEKSNQLKEIRVESFWGAVAAFFLYQIFGYIIFQAFLTYFSSSYLIIPLILYGMIFMIIFMFANALTMKKIREFFINQGSQTAIQSLHQKDDFIKFCLAIVFFVVLVLFALGYYPIPKKEHNLILLIAFFIFSWMVSIIYSRLTKKDSSIKVTNDKKGMLAGIFVGLWFLVISYIVSAVSGSYTLFYIFGMVGFGVIVLVSSALLLEDQIKTI